MLMVPFKDHSEQPMHDKCICMWVPWLQVTEPRLWAESWCKNEAPQEKAYAPQWTAVGGCTLGHRFILVTKLVLCLGRM